jgi:hypothetical protein
MRIRIHSLCFLKARDRDRRIPVLDFGRVLNGPSDTAWEKVSDAARVAVSEEVTEEAVAVEVSGRTILNIAY